MSRFLGIIAALLPAVAFADWTQLGQISPEAGISAKVTMDLQSNAVVTWISQDYKTEYAAFMPAGGSFQPPMVLGNTKTNSKKLQEPYLFIDLQGKCIAMWGGWENQKKQSTSAISSPVGEWDWFPIKRHLPHESGLLNAAADRSDNVLIAVSTYNSELKECVVGLSTLGPDGWSKPLPVGSEKSTLKSVYATPGLAVSNGHGFALWPAKLSGDQKKPWIQCARYDFAKEQWSGIVMQPVVTNMALLRDISVAMDEGGNVVAAVSGVLDDSWITLFTARFQADAQGGTFTRLSKPERHVSEAKVAVDQTGNAVALWVEVDQSKRYQLLTASAPAKGPFGEPTVLIEEARQIGDLQLVSTLAGDIVAAWGTLDGDTWAVQTAHKSLEQSWSPVETLSLSGRKPGVAIAENGTAIIAWQEMVEQPATAQEPATMVGGPVVAAQYEGLFPQRVPAPPPSFVGSAFSNELLEKQQCWLMGRWDPSPSPGVVKYEIYRDLKPLETVWAHEPLEIIHKMRCQHLNNRYSVAAVNEAGFSSFHVPLQEEPS